MAHIHHFRTLDQVQRLSLREVRSPQHTVANFAAFRGARFWKAVSRVNLQN